MKDHLDVADRMELHELASRYGNAIDARDWDRLATVFTDGAVYELRGFGGLDQRVETGAAICALMARLTTHPIAHHVTNVEIDAGGDRVRMYNMIIGTLPGGKAGSAEYRDVVVRTAAGWRIAERTVSLRRSPSP